VTRLSTTGCGTQKAFVAGLLKAYVALKHLYFARQKMDAATWHYRRCTWYELKEDSPQLCLQAAGTGRTWSSKLDSTGKGSYKNFL